MALANLDKITVTGLYKTLDGEPCTGQVTFSPSQVVIDGASGEIVLPVSFTAQLDGNGRFSIDLPATDDPDLEPQGWVYRVTEQVSKDGSKPPNAKRGPFNLAVPHDGGTVDLADVAPTGPVQGMSSDEYTLLSTFTGHRDNSDKHLGDFLSSPSDGDLLRHEGEDAWQPFRGTAVGQALVWNGSKWVPDSDTYPKLQKTAISATVGTGGDYGSINAALEDLSERFYPYRSAGLAVTLTLLSGFVVEEQVYIENGIDLSWITMSSEDATVHIDRSTQGGDGAFRSDRATLPIFDCVFDMGSEGTDDVVRVFNVFYASRLYLGANGGARGDASRLVQVHSSFAHFAAGASVEDSTGIGMRVSNGSRFFGASTFIRNNSKNNLAVSLALVEAAGITATGSVNEGGIAVTEGPAEVLCSNGDLSGNAGTALGVTGTGMARAGGANLSGAGSFGVSCARGGMADVANADARKGASDDPSDIRVVNGGIVFATGSTGGYSKTPNMWGSDGLIIDTALPDRLVGGTP